MIKSYIPKRSRLSTIKQNIRSKVLVRALKKTFKKNFNQLNEGINVLEFGPGYGDLAIELSKAFKIKNYYFIDHSQENLDHIQNVLKLKNASFFCHDANLLISEEVKENFNLVISSHVIEHLENPSKHLDDFYSLLEQDSYGLISTPNLDSLDAIKLGNNWRGYKDETHISLLSYDELEAEIQRKKFKISLSGTSPNSLMEILYQKSLNSIFFSKFHLGDSSNIIFKKSCQNK